MHKNLDSEVFTVTLFFHILF